LILAASALGGCTATSTSLTSASESVDEFALALTRVNQDSISVEVKKWTTGMKVIVLEDDTNFSKVLEYFNASNTKQITSKSATMVENGKTVTAQRTIPYPMGFILNFCLKDGSKVESNVTSDNIWFETGESIYEITVDPDFFPYLENLMNQQEVKESG